MPEPRSRLTPTSASKAGNRGGDIAKDATNLGNSIAKTSRTGNGGGDIAKEAVNLSGSITNTALSLAGLVRDEGEGHDHDN